MSDIGANLERVRERIARAAERSGRRGDDVLLIGVSKTVEVERIQHAVAASVHAPGERRARRGRARMVSRAGPARQARRPGRALDGHERGFRSGDRGGRDDGPGRNGHLRSASGEGHAMSLKGKKVGFIGSGNMGEALIKGLTAANVVPGEMIWASDVRGDRLKEIAGTYGIKLAPDNLHLVREADVVIMAVKPQIMAPVLREIASVFSRRKLMISLAAGVSTESIRASLGKDGRLIRVMPNTPALVLEGVTAIAKAEGLEPEDMDVAGEIFSAVGRVVVLDESLMDAVTGLSGSGPAYVALVIGSLADGGVKMGLDRIPAQPP